MGNTTGTRRRSGNLEVDSGSSPNRVDNFPGQKFLYQPSEDMDEALQTVLRSHMKDAQYEPVPMRRGSISDRPTKLPTFFKWEGPAKDVYVSGTFNNWKVKIPLVKSQGTFYTIIDLPEGEHQYKFHVDGEWRHDLSEPVIQNNLGTNNNVVRVQPSDFEVFEALRRDGENHKSTQSLSGSPPGRYSQEVPERSSTERTSGGPPLLPPHLLQVILNKNIPISCEPTLLPEPNHVMLNHLYALSIKDGVMVLSATHRYRKKFVTTLLYKPIS